MMNREDLRKITDSVGLRPMKKYTIRKLNDEKKRSCKNMKRTHDFGTYLMLLQTLLFEIFDDDGYGTYPGSKRW